MKQSLILETRKKQLLCIHIPKAAGMTLLDIVRKQYHDSRIFYIHGTHFEKSIKRFLNLFEDEKAKIECLIGHMPYGLHKHMPGPTDYLTILRHPVERVISHYYYVKRASGHYLHEIVESRNMSLEDYASSNLSPELSNGQVRIISGGKTAVEVFRHDPQPASRDLLMAARHNLSCSFVAVGLSERFDESLLLFREVLGWNDISYQKQNVTPNRPKTRELPSRVIRTIEKHNELDLELYEYACKLFESKLAEHKIKQTNLIIFRLKNQTKTRFDNIRKRIRMIQ